MGRAVVQLFRIPVSFKKTSCYALLDSGACSSFIIVKVLNKLLPIDIVHLEDKDAVPPFSTASGNPIKSYATYRLSFRLDNVPLVYDFHSLDLGHEAIILGLEFLEKFAGVLDMKERLLTLNINKKVCKFELTRADPGLFHIGLAATKIERVF